MPPSRALDGAAPPEVDHLTESTCVDKSGEWYLRSTVVVPPKFRVPIPGAEHIRTFSNRVSICHTTVHTNLAMAETCLSIIESTVYDGKTDDGAPYVQYYMLGG